MMKKVFLAFLFSGMAGMSYSQCGGVGQITDNPWFTNVTATSLTLSWTSATPRSNYEIRYGTTVALELTISNVGTNSFDLSGLTAGNTYYFQVVVVKKCTNSEGDPDSELGYSPIVNTIMKPPAPVATTVPAANISSSSFVAQWNQANGASTYWLEVSADNFVTRLPGYNGKQIDGGSTVTASVTGLAANTDYAFRLWSGNSSGTSGYSNAIPVKTHVTEPTTQATNISFTSLSETSATINCTAGNGSERIIVVRQDNPVTFNALDGSTYIANSNFATAINQGSGHKVVYKGNASSVVVTGLTLNTPYHVKVFELNGTGAVTNYLTTTATGNPASFSSLMTSPTSQATALNFPAFTNSSLGGSFTAAAGTTDGYIVLQRQGASPTGVPADGTTYAVGNTIGDATVVAVGNSTTFSRASLTAGTVYHYDVYTYRGAGAATNYLETSPLEGSRSTLANEPTSQPTNLVFSSLAPTSVQLGFTAAAGSPTGYLILRRQGNSPTGVPVDGTAYTVGNALGDATVIAAGSSTSVASAGLTANTVYHYDIVAYNGAGEAINYLTTAPLENNRTTLFAEPTAQATNLSFSTHTVSSVRINFNPAAGAPGGYLVIRKTGSASTGVPADGTSYTVGAALDGTIVSIGSSVQIDNTGLSSGTVYHYTIFSFNGSGAAINYLTTSPLVNATITLPDYPQGFATSENHANDIKVSWQAVTGAEEYELMVSSSQDFTQPVANYNPKIIDNDFLNHVVVGLTPSTVYYFKIRARNASGTSERYSDIESASTLSGGGTDELVLNDLDFEDSHADGQQQKISVKANGGIGTLKVDFYHRKLSETPFEKIAVTRLNDTYELDILDEWFDDFGIEFYFEVKDLANQTKVTPHHAILKKIPEVVVPVSSFGKSIKNYHIISIPYTLSGTRVRDVFEERMGSYDKKSWRLCQYKNNRIVDFADGLGASTLEQGQGYWFISKNEVELDFGEGTSYDASTPFVLELQEGWNQIGNPFPFSISWQDVLQANGNPAGVGNYYAFDQEFVERDLVAAFSGGFVFSDEDTELEFPASLPKITEGFNGRMSVTKILPAIAAADWMLPITLKQGEQTNSLAGVGMREDAVDGKDKYDRIRLPRFGDYLEFNVRQSAYAYDFLRSIVTVQDNYAWRYSIESSVQNEVELTWPSELAAGLDGQLILHDETQHIVLDMAKVGKHVASPDSKITIYFTKHRLLTIERMELGKPYPNPFQDELIFAYDFSLDEISNVSIMITDINGKVIWEKHEKRMDKTGMMTLSWNGLNREGVPVPDGLYLYRVAVTRGTQHSYFNGKVIKD